MVNEVDVDTQTAQDCGQGAHVHSNENFQEYVKEAPQSYAVGIVLPSIAKTATRLCCNTC